MAGEKFGVRNVFCDYYLDSLNEFSNLKYNRKTYENNALFTVMRIYGITEAG